MKRVFTARRSMVVAWLFTAAVGALPASGADSEASDSSALSQEDLDAGQQLVRAYCTRCHGLDAKGARAPDLSQRVLRHANSDASFERIITNGIPGTGMAAINVFQPAQLKQIIGFLQHQRTSDEVPDLTGDVANGEKLFAKHQCASCHWTGSSGGRRGPDLSQSWARVDYVRQAIMDPADDVDSRYQQVSLLGSDGRIVQGLRLREGSFFIQLIDEKEYLYTVSKTDVDQLTRVKISLMPSYKDLLTEEELNDLVAYVFSLRSQDSVPSLSSSPDDSPANPHN